jgi:hypothetical protein
MIMRHQIERVNPMFPCTINTKMESSAPGSIHDGLRILRALRDAMITCIDVDTAGGHDGEARRTGMWTEELEKAISIITRGMGTEG